MIATSGIAVQQNFDNNAFMGGWYQAWAPNDFMFDDGSSGCSKWNYKTTDPGFFEIDPKSQKLSDANNKNSDFLPDQFEMTIQGIFSRNDDGALGYAAFLSPYFEHAVLKTDYTNYMVMYTKITMFWIEMWSGAWVYTREACPQGNNSQKCKDATDAAKEVMQDGRMDVPNGKKFNFNSRMRQSLHGDTCLY